MKYILTESQNLRLKLIRRDQEIKELISLYSKRPLTNFHMVLEQVVVNLSNTFGIDWENKTFYFLKSYVKEHYSDYINKELKK